MTDITDVLTDTLEGDTATAAALLDRFDIREKTTVRVTPPAAAVGQTWRNKRSDRLVLITEVPAPDADPSHASSSIRWAALTGKGPATGEVWGSYWTAKFEFIAAAPAPTTPTPSSSTGPEPHRCTSTTTAKSPAPGRCCSAAASK